MQKCHKEWRKSALIKRDRHKNTLQKLQLFIFFSKKINEQKELIANQVIYEKMHTLIF